MEGVGLLSAVASGTVRYHGESWSLVREGVVDLSAVASGACCGTVEAVSRTPSRAASSLWVGSGADRCGRAVVKNL